MGKGKVGDLPKEVSRRCASLRLPVLEMLFGAWRTGYMQSNGDITHCEPECFKNLALTGHQPHPIPPPHSLSTRLRPLLFHSLSTIKTPPPRQFPPLHYTWCSEENKLLPMLEGAKGGVFPIRL